MKQRVTREVVIERIQQRHNGTIKLIGDYVDSQTSCNFKCLNDGCGRIWQTAPNNVMQGSGCRDCIDNNRRIPHDVIVQRIEDKHNGTISLLGKYTGSLEIANFHCNVCHYEWYTTTSSVIQGSGCSVCGNKRGAVKRKPRLYTHDVIVQRIEDKHNGTISLIGQYTGSNEITNFHCNVCHYEWYTTTSSVIRGSGCGACGRKRSVAKRKLEFTL